MQSNQEIEIVCVCVVAVLFIICLVFSSENSSHPALSLSVLFISIKKKILRKQLRQIRTTVNRIGLQKYWKVVGILGCMHHIQIKIAIPQIIENTM